jgi:hypothetical protein
MFDAHPRAPELENAIRSAGCSYKWCNALFSLLIGLSAGFRQQAARQVPISGDMHGRGFLIHLWTLKS